VRTRRLLIPLAAAVLGAAGCGGSGPSATTTAPQPRTPPPAEHARAEREKSPEQPKRRSHPPTPRCPQAAANCQAAQGRVLSLESHDADGDGDLHLILASDASVTLPGITVLDVSKDLRPARDPRVGDWAAGAGPVYSGSYGQHQIQVERVVYDPRRG
jgi:hypothetical protein